MIHWPRHINTSVFDTIDVIDFELEYLYVHSEKKGSIMGKNINFFGGVCLFVMGATGYSVVSETTLCERAGMRREIKVIYDDPMADAACKVRYRKKDEAPGFKKILWRAEYEVGFCQTKASELVARLQNWGWTCKDKTPLKQKY